MHTLEEFNAEMWLDQERGRFFWHKSGPGRRADLQVGAVDGHGYGQLQFKGVVYKEHRVVWLFVTGEWPSEQIDHIDHDRRNNVFTNLRMVNNQENHKNVSMQKNNVSGMAGVHFDKSKSLFNAYVTSHGVRKNLGWFGTFEEAAAARKAANASLGFHRNHGIKHSVAEMKKEHQNNT